MYQWLLHIFFILYGTCLVGQTTGSNIFYIENEQVVLQFTKDQWFNGIKDSTSIIYDFRTFELEDELNSGFITQWSKDGWTLRNIDKETFQLRKKYSEFNHEFSNMIKYQINSQNWNAPVSEPISHPNEFKTIKKVKDIKIDKNGNSLFKLNGYSNAKKVILSGTFNHWDTQAIRMQKTSTGWQITMDLPPGIYEYKFIIDDDWIHDPNNPLTVTNEHFTLNSILLVGDYITFTLKDHIRASRVILSGSFNNWNEHTMKMKKTDKGWEYTLPLPPGKHYYKFIVDGKWILDPENAMQQRDKNQHINSVLLIH